MKDLHKLVCEGIEPLSCDDLPDFFRIRQGYFLTVKTEHIQESQCHFIGGMSSQPEHLFICRECQRLSGIQFAVYGNIQAFTDEDVRQFCAGIICAYQDPDSKAFFALGIEGIQLPDQFCNGIRLFPDILFGHFGHHNATGLSGGGRCRGMSLELHCFDGSAEHSLFIGRREQCRLKDFVHGFDDGFRRTVREFQSAEEISVCAII